MMKIISTPTSIVFVLLKSILLIVVMIWLFTGCLGQQSTPVAVEPPTISDPKISAPTPQEPGEEIGISVDVSSAAGVSLAYEWNADGGEIVRGQGSPAITYRTPEEPGIYNVRVTVSWDNSSVEKVTTIRVEAPASEPPTDEGEMPELAPPIGQVDAGTGGGHSIRGIVRDSSGTVAPDVYVALTAYRGGVGEESMGELWDESAITDETGGYAFNNLPRVEGGHYQIWLNSPQEYEKVYEDSGYYVNENEISGDTYLLNITVHPVTGSAFSSVIQYEDADGATKNFLSNPPGTDLFIELNRGTDDNNHEYTVGSGDDTDDGSAVYFSSLAGGTYYLIIQYTRSDGVRVDCRSPSFEIPPGETKQFDYTIPWGSCYIQQ